MTDPDRPWNTPEQREANWKQWAMEQAVKLCAGRTLDYGQLEAVADRIYRWTAFPAKRPEPKEKTDA
jgi:hypothetical protein